MSKQTCGRVAFITGISGQDGSYLAELLLEKEYEVHGLIRRNSGGTDSAKIHLKQILDRIHLHHGDVLDQSCLLKIIEAIRPDEIYNLAAQAHVSYSFQAPTYTMQVNVMGLLHLLTAIVHCDLQGKVRLYQASSSEMYGGDSKSSLNESSLFNPQSPYATSKLTCYYLIRNYRASHNLFAVNGICFNHESRRRAADSGHEADVLTGAQFVTMRIARGAARYKLEKTNGAPLTLAGVGMLRDWGHAKDYVGCMWLMLQREAPHDFVVATGEAKSVMDFANAAFACIDVDLEWEGCGLDLVAKSQKTSDVVIRMDPKLIRPAEVTRLCGDSSYARKELGWVPTISFEDMVSEMVHSEIDRMTREG